MLISEEELFVADLLDMPTEEFAKLIELAKKVRAQEQANGAESIQLTK